jgi:hypothetical protein
MAAFTPASRVSIDDSIGKEAGALLLGVGSIFPDAPDNHCVSRMQRVDAKWRAMETRCQSE